MSQHKFLPCKRGLIAPYWNVNLERIVASTFSKSGLIAPYWNVNCSSKTITKKVTQGLIAPYWNVNSVTGENLSDTIWSYVNILDTKSQTFLCCTSS